MSGCAADLFPGEGSVKLNHALLVPLPKLLSIQEVLVLPPAAEEQQITRW